MNRVVQLPAAETKTPMPQLDEVVDIRVRTLLQTAHDKMREGEAAAAVHAGVDGFLRLWELRPRELAGFADPSRHSEIPVTQHWPGQGVLVTLDDEQPVVTYERERFTINEAISYYEFVLELAVALEA